MVVLAIVLAISIGLATAAQSPTNASLGSVVGPIQASMVSMIGGFTILVLLCPFIGTGNIFLVTQAQPWMLLGGVYGAFIVFVMAATSPRLGVALTLTVFMLGQLVSGMVVDTFGLVTAEQVPFSGLRLAGVLLVFAGIACVYVGRIRYSSAIPAPTKNAGGEARSGSPLGAALLCFIGGLISAVQTPTNASLGALVGSVEGGIINFAGGFLALLVALLVVNKGKLNSFKGVRPWQLTGGIYGAFGVPALIIATPPLGVGLVLATMMFGQLVGGMVVDALGLFGSARMRMDVLRIVGALLLLVGIALVTAARMGVL